MHKINFYNRYEPAVTAPQEKAEAAYWFVFCKNKLLIDPQNGDLNIPYLKNPKELSICPDKTYYLGCLLDSPCYAACVSDEVCPNGMAFEPFKSLYETLDHDIFMLAGRASQIIDWDQTNQFCGRCGELTVEIPGERAKKCPKCGFISYPRICPAVITAVFRDDKILLAHARNYHGDVHSLIAGFLEPGETLEECVQREIKEEVNLKVKNIRYFGSQPWPFPNSMMVGFTANYESGEICVDGVEISKAGWFSADNLPELPGKMSIAYEIIEWYLNQHK